MRRDDRDVPGPESLGVVQELDLTPAERAARARLRRRGTRATENTLLPLRLLSRQLLDARARRDRPRRSAARCKAATATAPNEHDVSVPHAARAADDRAVAIGHRTRARAVADRPITPVGGDVPPGAAAGARARRAARAARTAPRARSSRASSVLFTRARAPPSRRAAADTSLRVSRHRRWRSPALLGVLAARRGPAPRGRARRSSTPRTSWASLAGILGVAAHRRLDGHAAHVHGAQREPAPVRSALARAGGRAAARDEPRSRGRASRRCAAVVAVVALLGLALQAAAGFDQVNVAVIALTLPAHLALALGARERSSPTTRAPVGAARARAAVSRSAA